MERVGAILNDYKYMANILKIGLNQSTNLLYMTLSSGLNSQQSCLILMIITSGSIQSADASIFSFVTCARTTLPIYALSKLSPIYSVIARVFSSCNRRPIICNDTCDPSKIAGSSRRNNLSVVVITTVNRFLGTYMCPKWTDLTDLLV